MIGVIIGGSLGVLIAMLTGGLISELEEGKLKVIWSFGLIFSLIFGLFGGLTMGVFSSTGLMDSLKMGGLLAGGLIGLLIARLITKPAGVSLKAVWPLRKARTECISGIFGLLSGLWVGIVFGMLLALFMLRLLWIVGGLEGFDSSTLMDVMLNGGMIFGGGFGLICSGMGMMIGGLMGDSQRITPVGLLKWSWAKARKGLGVSLLAALLTGSSVVILILFLEISFPTSEEPLTLWQYLVFILLAWLFFGLMLSPIGGVVGGLKSQEVETTVRPNQGIWQSGKNALFVTPIVFLICLLSGWLINGSKNGLWVGLLLALNFGLIFGGRAFIQHFILRFILYRHRDLPWGYTRFLDYAAERIFLRKVGGGYIFIHRLLLDYFASLDQSDIQQLAQDL
jgi:hypothetical protein